jgi:hypothetical protein
MSMFLCIYLFNDALCNSDCVALNDMMINEWWTEMMWREAVMACFKSLSHYVPQVAEEYNETTQDGRSPVRDLKPRLNRYTAGV